jgi:membrane protein YqaA with SNARE-associated domain
MRGIVDRVRALALAWGAPGLFAVAFLDSSFLPLPGITDVLLIVLVTRHPSLAPLYIVATMTGSIAGCLVMHYIGKKGGEALVRKRFAGPRVEQAMASLQRHGVMAVLIPCLLPPPAPFKIFLLLAGAVGISAARFAAAIAIGRGIRYVTLGFLAVRYGERARTFLLEHGTAASLVLVGTIGAGFAAYLVWSKAKGVRNR